MVDLNNDNKINLLDLNLAINNNLSLDNIITLWNTSEIKLFSYSDTINYFEKVKYNSITNSLDNDNKNIQIFSFYRNNEWIPGLASTYDIINSRNLVKFLMRSNSFSNKQGQIINLNLIGWSENFEYLKINTNVGIVNHNNENKYVFNNNLNYINKYVISLGTYYFNNIPENHPLAILIDSDIIEYYGIDTNGYPNNDKLSTKEVDGEIRNFYWGNIKVIVKQVFVETSIYCFYDGYMGGENILMYLDVNINNKQIENIISENIRFGGILLVDNSNTIVDTKNLINNDIDNWSNLQTISITIPDNNTYYLYLVDTLVGGWILFNKIYSKNIFNTINYDSIPDDDILIGKIRSTESGSNTINILDYNDDIININYLDELYIPDFDVRIRIRNYVGYNYINNKYYLKFQIEDSVGKLITQDSDIKIIKNIDIINKLYSDNIGDQIEKYYILQHNNDLEENLKPAIIILNRTQNLLSCLCRFNPIYNKYTKYRVDYNNINSYLFIDMPISYGDNSNIIIGKRVYNGYNIHWNKISQPLLHKLMCDVLCIKRYVDVSNTLKLSYIANIDYNYDTRDYKYYLFIDSEFNIITTEYLDNNIIKRTTQIKTISYEDAIYFYNTNNIPNNFILNCQFIEYENSNYNGLNDNIKFRYENISTGTFNGSVVEQLPNEEVPIDINMQDYLFNFSMYYDIYKLKQFSSSSNKHYFQDISDYYVDVSFTINSNITAISNCMGPDNWVYPEHIYFYPDPSGDYSEFSYDGKNLLIWNMTPNNNILSDEIYQIREHLKIDLDNDSLWLSNDDDTFHDTSDNIINHINTKWNINNFAVIYCHLSKINYIDVSNNEILSNQTIPDQNIISHGYISDHVEEKNHFLIVKNTT